MLVGEFWGCFEMDLKSVEHRSEDRMALEHQGRSHCPDSTEPSGLLPGIGVGVGGGEVDV